MKERPLAVKPVTLLDLGAITRMSYANMKGVDKQFTGFIHNPIGRVAGYLLLPLYLSLAGKGYKAEWHGRIAGCAYIHLRQWSGYVFNVSVNPPYRRQGIARTLMNHLEDVARTKKLHWLALQVDEGNGAARTLYRQLGYREYHPCFLCREDTYTLIGPTGGAEVKIERLERQERRLFNRYSALERQVGDSWADRVVGSEYAPEAPVSGAHWRVIVQGKEMGYLWLGEQNRRAVIFLMLKPELWGDLAAVKLIGLLLERLHRPPAQVEVHFGSSQHYETAVPLLQPLGFQPRTQPRVLMLKLVNRSGLGLEPHENLSGKSKT